MRNPAVTGLPFQFQSLERRDRLSNHCAKLFWKTHLHHDQMTPTLPNPPITNGYNNFFVFSVHSLSGIMALKAG
jgi:hypothetical protein